MFSIGDGMAVDPVVLVHLLVIGQLQPTMCSHKQNECKHCLIVSLGFSFYSYVILSLSPVPPPLPIQLSWHIHNYQRKENPRIIIIRQCRNAYFCCCSFSILIMIITTRNRQMMIVCVIDSNKCVHISLKYKLGINKYV